MINLNENLSRALTAGIAAALFAGIAACAQHGGVAEPQAEAGVYDPELAEALGADPYGMRSYVLVTLVTGPADIEDEERRNALFRGHFANMKQMAERGELVLAGPLTDSSGKRGIFILNAETEDAARELVVSDPAVAAGIFEVEYSQLYASAALMQLNDWHSRIQREAIE